MTGERILVVDDGDEIRDFVVNYILKPSAYDYIEASDGLEGLELIRSRSPDLVLLDLQMPRLDGIGVLHQMQAEGLNVPVILMTSYGSEEIAIEVFRMGVRDYVIKPFEAEELLSAIERALEEKRLREERDHLMEHLLAANEELRAQVRELEALYGAGREIVTAPDSGALFARLLRAASRIASPLAGELFLLSDDGRSLIRVARLEDGHVRPTDEQTDDELAWQVIRAGEPRLGAPELVPSSQAFSVPVGVPLGLSEVRGALLVTLLADPLSEHRVNTLTALAVFGAIGLEFIRCKTGDL